MTRTWFSLHDSSCPLDEAVQPGDVAQGYVAKTVGGLSCYEGALSYNPMFLTSEIPHGHVATDVRSWSFFASDCVRFFRARTLSPAKIIT